MLLTEVLPLDRYIRAVAICNSLALLASQGTMTQFLQRIAVLTRLQKYWTKGYDSVTLACDASEANDDDDDSNSPDNETAVISNSDAVPEPTENQDDNWETHSNSTVDLKPDIHANASEPELSEPEPEPEPQIKTNSKIHLVISIFNMSKKS